VFGDRATSVKNARYRSTGSIGAASSPTTVHTTHGSLLLLALVKSAVSGAGMVRRRWSVSTSFVRWGAPR
jgi:hypothetical protein